MKHNPRHSQRGLTLLMVMLLMTAMLMGALGFARVTEVGTLVSNNVANKDSSIQAAEVGRATAFAALQGLAAANTLDNDNGGWYWASMQNTTQATGIPVVNFDAAASVAGDVGRFTVRYAVERLCTSSGEIKESRTKCLVLVKPKGEDSSGDLDDMAYTPKDYAQIGARQYRITVRVSDARGMQTWTQSLVTLN